MLSKLPAYTIFAHRGASAHAPENTLAAFQMAVEHGAHGIELDAKLCADGHVIVLHDATVNRTTNGKGKAREIPLKHLKLLDAGGWFDSQFAGEQIPTLEEVFKTIGDRLYINVELTNYSSPRDNLVEKVVELVRVYHLEDSVLFSSFSPRNILNARKLAPEIPGALLALPGVSGWLARSRWLRKVSPCVVHPYFTEVDTEFMDRQKSWGRRVHVWTVNDINEMKRLKRLRVGGIFTDDPRLACQVLEQA